MMNKARTTLSIDQDLLKEVKEKNMNISQVLEDALIEKLDITEVKIKHFEKCDFCGNEDLKAKAQYLKGVTWLWPHEKWICDRCLREKSFATIRGARE